VPLLAVLAVRSDEEVEHFSDLWLEVVVLDSLVELIVDSDMGQKFDWESFYARGTPERAAQLPLLDAPPTEAELFALLDLSVAEVEMANSEALEGNSEVTEGGLTAPCTSVVASVSPAAAWTAGLWPSGGAPPSEAELVALYARARAASPAGLSIGEVHAALVLEPALRHLTLADVKKANSKALKGGLLTAPGASADARGGAGEDGGSSRGTSASGASTHEDRAADVPRRLSRLEDHVQQAFRNFEKTVGATQAECKKYGARLDAKTLVALKAMSVDTTARNYALGTKAFRLVEEEAKKKGVVSDDMVYWYMAVMYAEDQKLRRADRMLTDFETPSARDVEKVRAHILREFGAK